MCIYNYMNSCFVINHDLMYIGFVKMISLAQNMNNSTLLTYQVRYMFITADIDFSYKLK